MNDFSRSRPGALIGLGLTGIILGSALGALTNTISGWVSPEYFRQVMGWKNVQDVWRASIAEGIFEGLLFGLAFSVIFVAVVGLVSRARCPYGLGAVYLALTAVAALAFWAIGGVLGMGLAALSPEFFQHAFRGVPEEFAPMIRYAWVGGSIQGVQLGGLASVIVAAVLFRARWRGLVDRAEGEAAAGD
jgi:hypothetical protein